jgi:Outer membrane protein beta-barrel domain
MNIFNAPWSRKAFAKYSAAAGALLLSLVPAYGQNWELAPLVGARFGGTIKVEQGDANFDAHIADSLSYGLIGGYRFEQDGEGFGVISFRWMRQDSHLGVNQIPLVVNPLTPVLFRPSITLDHFMADFSHEFTVDEEYHIVQPFISVSLGAARMGAPASSATRFAFGFGTGVKIFPSRHWGLRVGFDYMPVVMHAELQSLVCGGGACSVALNGGIMNQFEVSLGPAFRF